MAEQSNSETNLQDSHPQAGSIQVHLQYKNRLQEFTQRAGIPLPVYQSINEAGLQDVPKFRSIVEVDGVSYTSLNTFSHKKAAEQDVARIALEGISKQIEKCITQKTTYEGFPPIYEDKAFCKSILHEFAAKTNIEKPVYNTVKLEGSHPVFVSSLVFNGVTYRGEPDVSKKDAERLAARAVILSILGNPGERTLLFEIIKSKSKYISARKRSCSDIDGGVSPLGSNSEALQGHSPHKARHEFVKPLSKPVSEAISLPITFVSPLQGQPSVESSACIEDQNSKNKKKKKKKKKANKKLKTDAQTLLFL